MALMPAENETAVRSLPSTSPSRQAASEPADGGVGAVGVGAGHDDRELVATDPERAVASGAGTSAMVVAGRAEEPVADRVAARVVDLLEVVEVDDRERQRLVVAGRRRPLALDLLLERAVVAEPGQRVAERLGAGPVVGVLEDPRASSRRSAGSSTRRASQTVSSAEDDGEHEHAQRRHEQRGAEPPRPGRRSPAPRWRSGSANIVTARGTGGAGRGAGWSTRRGQLPGVVLVVDRCDSCGWGRPVSDRYSRAEVAARTSTVVLVGRRTNGCVTRHARGRPWRRVHPVCGRGRSAHRRGDRRIAGAARASCASAGRR